MHEVKWENKKHSELAKQSAGQTLLVLRKSVQLGGGAGLSCKTEQNPAKSEVLSCTK